MSGTTLKNNKNVNFNGLGSPACELCFKQRIHHMKRINMIEFSQKYNFSKLDESAEEEAVEEANEDESAEEEVNKDLNKVQS